MKHAIASGLLVFALVLGLAAIDPSFFVKDDFQLEFLPASHEIAHAWMAGEVPLLTRASWMCAALAAEYQFGVFSIFRMFLEALAWLLPLSLTGRGILLFATHAAIAGAGGFLLARSYGVRPAHAVMVAVIAGLNGWILWWGTSWYAITASFAWLPWYWLGLRGIAEGKRWSWIGAAIALYLLITAGAPYVVAMAMFVFLINVGRALVRRDGLKPVLRLIAASALGLALAAPAVLMLLEYFPYTARSNAATRFEHMWSVPPLAFFGLPSQWNTFRGAVTRWPVELLGAFLPLVAVLWSAATQVAAVRQRQLRCRTPHLIAPLIILIALMLLPSAGPFRWSFRWLPLFHVILALLGAIALERVQRAWPALLTIAMIVIAFVSFHDRDEVSRFTIIEERAPLDPARRYLAMYGLGSILGNGAHTELLPGNLPMLAGQKFINGYSPMGPAWLNDLFQFVVHGPMRPTHAEQMLRFESGRNQLLHHIGVDGLIVPIVVAQRNEQLLARNGWRPVARIADCFVLHREPLRDPIFQAALAIKTPNERDAYAAIFSRKTPQLPVVLLTDERGAGFSPPRRAEARPTLRERYGPRRIEHILEERNATSFVVRGNGPKALVVFRRPWLPGWRAAIDGRPLPVLRADVLMPAVEIPANAEGEVRLVYRPRSLVLGSTIAGLALLAMAAVAVRIRGDR